MRAAYALALASGALAQAGPWPSVPHFWPQYPTRRTTVLNGTWAQGWAPPALAATPELIAYSDIKPALNATATVPSSFDVAPLAIKGPRTTAFYRSVHACTPGAASLARFYAVNF